jgi:hypothetical protein
MSARIAKAIRKNIKSILGFNARQVSVRAESFAGGSSVTIVIKVPAAKSKIEEIAKAGERIDHCSVTGEILAGANTYVHVSYGDGVLESIYGEYLDLIKALAEDPGKLLRLPGAFEEYTICFLDDCYHVEKGNDLPKRAWQAHHAGELFAEMMLEELAQAKAA